MVTLTRPEIVTPTYTGPERRRRIHALSDSEFGRIVDAVGEGERLRAMDGRFDAIERSLDVGSARMQRIEDKLDGNSATTAEVRDLLDSGRALFRFAAGFGRFVRWAAGLAAAGAALWAAWSNHRPP